VHHIPLRTLAGAPATLPARTTLLIVNVASRCGFTPQYAGLERLHERFAGDGFSVVGFPSTGPGRHPLYAELVETPDADGRAGDVQWNFEKFLVDPAGSVVARFRTRTDPEAPEIVEAIRASLPDRVT